MIAVLDIGGTAIKYGAAEPECFDGRFASPRELPTEARTLGGSGVLRRICEIVRELSAEGAVEGIALSTAGMIDPESGTVLYANDNIPGYTGMRLKAALEEEFRVPCEVENDVKAAALGEFTYGAGRGFDSILMLAVGTGIGAALVCGGEVFRGSSGSAGEVGYMWVDGRHFQEEASASALVRRVEDAAGESGLDGRRIFERAAAGDGICLREIRRLCRDVMTGAANCICMMDPQALVLGGGIMAQRELLEPILAEEMRALVHPAMAGRTALRFAELQNGAGMAGALAHFQRMVRRRERGG